jgi:uncharacterized membrane protein
VIAYFGGSALVTAGMLAIGVATSQTALLVGGMIAGAIVAIEACIYVPRACRAMRDSRSN